MTSPRGSRKADQAKELRDNIRSLMHGFRDRVEEAMRPEGMTLPQLRMLWVVQEEAGASSAAIARQCQVTPQTLQTMLQRAVREGWLVREPAARNARILTAALTPKGVALLVRAKQAVSEFEMLVWRDVSVAELEAMNRALHHALRRVEQAGSAAAATRRPATKNIGKPKVAAKH